MRYEDCNMKVTDNHYRHEKPKKTCAYCRSEVNRRNACAIVCEVCFMGYLVNNQYGDLICNECGTEWYLTTKKPRSGLEEFFWK